MLVDVEEVVADSAMVSPLLSLTKARDARVRNRHAALHGTHPRKLERSNHVCQFIQMDDCVFGARVLSCKTSLIAPARFDTCQK